MGYLSLKYKLQKFFKGKYGTWWDIISELDYKKKIEFTIEVIKKESLQYKDIKELLDTLKYGLYNPDNGSTIEISDIEKLRDAIESANINFEDANIEDNNFNDILYSIFSRMNTENIRKAVKEGRECWDANEMIMSMLNDVWEGIGFEEIIDIILKNNQEIDFKKSEADIVDIFTYFEAKSSTMEEKLDKLRPYLDDDSVEQIVNEIKQTKQREFEKIKEEITDTLRNNELDTNEKMKKIEEHIDILHSEDIFGISFRVDDDIKIAILNKYHNKIGRFYTLRMICNLSEEKKKCLNFENLNLKEMDIKQIKNSDSESLSYYISETEDKEKIKCLKKMIMHSNLRADSSNDSEFSFEELGKNQLDKLIEYANSSDEDLPNMIGRSDDVSANDLYVVTKNQIDRVNKEVSDDKSKKASVLAWLIGRAKNVDVKKILKEDISIEIAKKIYCDYYLNLYMLSEEDEKELREYLELGNEQELEEANEDDINKKYNKMKNSLLYIFKGEDEDTLDTLEGKKISLFQIRTIISKIEEDKLDVFETKKILKEFLLYTNGTDFVEILKNYIDKEMAREIYYELNNSLKPIYKLSHEKRRELEDYFDKDERENEINDFVEPILESAEQKNDEIHIPAEYTFHDTDENFSEIKNFIETSANSEKDDENKQAENDVSFIFEDNINPEETQKVKKIEDKKAELEKTENDESIEEASNDVTLSEEEKLEYLDDNFEELESSKIKELLLSLSKDKMKYGYYTYRFGLTEDDEKEVEEKIAELEKTENDESIEELQNDVTLSEEEKLEYLDDNFEELESSKIKELLLSLSKDAMKYGYYTYRFGLTEDDKKEVEEKIKELETGEIITKISIVKKLLKEYEKLRQKAANKTK